MGSANINDRSQKGDGDSEIALVVEDDEDLQTTMNGFPYAASKFAATLRRRLYRGSLECGPILKSANCKSRASWSPGTSEL